MATETKNTKAFYTPKAFGAEIPSDWEIMRLEDACSHFKSGFGITSEQISESGEYPVYGGNGLRGFTNSFTHNGDYLLIGRQGALCGNIQRVSNKVYISEHAIAVQTNHNNDIDFLAYKLEFKNLNRLSESSAQPGLAVEKLLRLKIEFPPLPEQKAIAQVLSTADAAIHTTSTLIAQKEQRKKWLMQQLLTGKKRLKGFGGEWKEMKLGKIIEICSSKRVLEEDWKTEGVPFFRTREIIKLSNNEELKSPIFITELLFQELKSRYGVPKPNDILVTGVGTIGETYIVKEEDKFYFKDGNVLWFKMNEKVNSYFLTQLFKTVYVRKQLLDNASITTVATFTIEGAKNTKIKLPSLEEQTAIAQVLQAADKEISLLKAKAEKLREQKKGLMQQLLTGKVRLKLNN